VGERLVYVGNKKDPAMGERPNGWLVVFRAGDDTLFAAAQTYFVTEDCWRGIEKFFRAASAKAVRAVPTGRFGLAGAAKRTVRPRPTKKNLKRKHPAIKD